MYDILQYQFNNSIKNYGYDVKVNKATDIRVLFMEYDEGRSSVDNKYMLVENGLVNQGDMITFFNDNWFVTGENISINDVYTKFVIRNCNFDLKLIIDDKLYLFYSIAEGNKFTTTENSYLIMSSDVITVTLPSTDTTNQIKMDSRFIKWGRAWKVQGIDKTKKGLVILTCQSDTIGADDDMENEIANRYDGTSNDRLNGNIEPILPFETPVEPEPPVGTYSIGISPNDTIIRSGNTITFTVEKYLNDVLVSNNFEITLDSSTTASPSDYEFSTVDNTYAIRNIIDSYEYVTVKIVDLDGHLEDKIVSYQLTGIFG